MAVQKQDGLFVEQAESAVDLKGKEMLAVARDANGKVNIAGAGVYVDGIISEGKPQGKHTSYNTAGNPILRWIAGAAIAANVPVASDAQGRCVLATGGAKVFGKTRKAVSAAGVVAEIIPGRNVS